jgi:hypothetical protein
MSATKSAKQGTKVQAAKAKTKAKTATKKPTAKDAPKASPDECPRGGKHVWKDDGDGQPCCEKCFEPAPKGKNAKPAKANKPAKDQSPKRLSAIDAAAKVLSESKTAMNAKELIDAIAAQGLWSSPGGKTPHATLYSAILREIGTKGNDARFKKTERGKFAASVRA